MGKLTFRKEERLKKEKDIQELFNRGSSFYLYPFKIILLPDSQENFIGNRVLISVSKRNFKRAVDRNKIKRRVREAYRLQKEVLSGPPFFKIGFIYTPKEIISSADISQKMVHALKRISRSASEITNPK